jgi:DNA-binding transcriptional ArsR family regulator
VTIKGVTIDPGLESRTDGLVDEEVALSVAACLFHGFSDASRLAIVRHLALGEHRVVDLTEHLGLAQSTVSKHLACLRDCGLVESRPQGRASLFSLTHPEATLQLLSAAEQLLALTGDAVALCPVYGQATQNEAAHS